MPTTLADLLKDSAHRLDQFMTARVLESGTVRVGDRVRALSS